MLDTGPVDTSKLFRVHRLSLLLPGVKAVFDGIGWTWETDTAGINSFEDFEELVRGIEELDPESYNFRYPTGTKGQAVLNHHTVVNPVEFSHNMDPILDLLAGAVLGLHEEFNATAAAKFELQDMVKRPWEVITTWCSGPPTAVAIFTASAPFLASLVRHSLPPYRLPLTRASEETRRRGQISG